MVHGLYSTQCASSQQNMAICPLFCWIYWDANWRRISYMEVYIKQLMYI